MSPDARLDQASTVDGALAHVLSEAQALADETSRDVTALLAAVRALEAAIQDARRRATEESRRFAHELRSPLNALAGWAQILRDAGGEAATAAQAAGVIERSVAALARTIDARPR